jgi:UDP-N-acetylglucosamine--N-acetylmuramyl-(pentapeptide) pyrophosphoryl-undecaprenol N-acetylglucosamine transferase
MKRNSKNIFLTGGGTGGHLFPALAMAELLKENMYEPIVFTDSRCKNYIPDNLNFRVEVMDLPRPDFRISNIKAFFREFIKTTKYYTELIRSLNPSLVIACGGYSSLPLLVATIFSGVKLVIHEQNAIIGRTNFWFSIFAKKFFISFEKTHKIPFFIKNNIVWTGSPLLYKLKKKDNSNREIGDVVKILITGGSQGAKIFDEIVPDAIEILKYKFSGRKFIIFQQTSSKDFSNITERYKNMGIDSRVQNFFHDIENYYEKIDIYVGRSGASTINEIIEYRIPSIFVPYPFAKDNHQFFNSLNFLQYNAAIIIDQANLNPDKLAESIGKYIENRNLVKSAIEGIAKLKIDSNKIILSEIKKIIDK